MSRTTLGAVAAAVASAGFGVVFSAFHAPHWLGFLALAVTGAALLVLVLQLPFVTSRIPWEFRRKQAEDDRKWFLNLVEWVALRRELQNHFRALPPHQPPPQPAELRAWAAAFAASLEKRGYAASAKKVEMQLGDDALPDAVNRRRSDLQHMLILMLLWDEFERT
jgi:hypothetical protein